MPCSNTVWRKSFPQILIVSSLALALSLHFNVLLKTDGRLKSSSQSRVVDTREVRSQDRRDVSIADREYRRTDLVARSDKKLRRGRFPLPAQGIELVGHGERR